VTKLPPLDGGPSPIMSGAWIAGEDGRPPPEPPKAPAPPPSDFVEREGHAKESRAASRRAGRRCYVGTLHRSTARLDGPVVRATRVPANRRGQSRRRPGRRGRTTTGCQYTRPRFRKLDCAQGHGRKVRCPLTCSTNQHRRERASGAPAQEEQARTSERPGQLDQLCGPGEERATAGSGGAHFIPRASATATNRRRLPRRDRYSETLPIKGRKPCRARSRRLQRALQGYYMWGAERRRRARADRRRARGEDHGWRGSEAEERAAREREERRRAHGRAWAGRRAPSGPLAARR